ncbi:MAG: PIN domain-containing protein [Candidatus Aenigmarchaeota archaeon]|nr:PIN domain-containing protein [Candidatus Aenigmarchaeota archaeon]
MYVADTHAWLYYILDKLPKTADQAFKLAESGLEVILVPSIALNECIWLIERGKISIDYKELFGKFDLSSNFIVFPLDLKVTKEVPYTKLGELHDRIIVATANITGSTLITKDSEIAESDIVKTIWK